MPKDTLYIGTDSSRGRMLFEPIFQARKRCNSVQKTPHHQTQQRASTQASKLSGFSTRPPIARPAGATPRTRGRQFRPRLQTEPLVFVSLGSDDRRCPPRANHFASDAIPVGLACVAWMAKTLACSNVVAAPAVHAPLCPFHHWGNMVSVGLPLLWADHTAGLTLPRITSQHGLTPEAVLPW